jgi:phosphoglycerate kinase
MKTLDQLTHVKGKCVLLRADFNVPLKDGKVSDPFRIDATIPTIAYLQKKGAKIIIISHIGADGTESLKPVADYLNETIPLTFVPEVVGEKVKEQVAALEDGEVLLLENLREDHGELEDSKLFAIELSELADIYVNDAFSVCHREQASVVIVPKLLPSYAGLLLEKEITELDAVLNHPRHPFLFILGGAKFSTKLPLIEKFLETADTVFIGGALVNNLLRDKGLNIGDSLLDDEAPSMKDMLSNKKLILPIDVVVISHGSIKTVGIEEVGNSDVIVDIGPKTANALAPHIHDAAMVLMNGPLGKGEYTKGTEAILEMLVASKGKKVIGGGDTSEIITKLGIHSKLMFDSTGGGATLEYLAKGTLPGIEALG